MPFPVELPAPLQAKALSLGILPQDVEESFIRGSGHGGQKVNKTSSCVQLRHVPSSTEIRCQKHREQSKNRVSAWKLLIEKIEEMKLGKESEKAQKIFKLRKQKQRRSKKAKEKMLGDKHHRGEVKTFRSSFENLDI